MKYNKPVCSKEASTNHSTTVFMKQTKHGEKNLQSHLVDPKDL